MKVLYIIIICFSLLACQNHESKQRFATESIFEVADEEDIAKMEVLPTAQPAQPLERKLIRNGRLSFRAKEVKSTKMEIEKQVKALDGYINNESQNNYDDRLSYEQTIRVPAARFDELIQKIEALASHVDNRTIDTDDVTEEFIDVETRLATKKDLEKRYRELLAHASKVEELLSVERELSNVRSEIESMEGRLNYLKNQVALSTLVVTYYEEKNAEFGFGSKVMASFGEGWSNLLYFFIALLNVWPFVILMAIGVVVFLKIRKKRKMAVRV
jgi:hypothetical protein